MEQQVAIAERFPLLQQPQWGRDQTLRAGKLMESFSPAIELDENIQRQALTDYETTKARLSEIHQIEAKLKTSIVHDVHSTPSKRGRKGEGRPKKAGSNSA